VGILPPSIAADAQMKIAVNWHRVFRVYLRLLRIYLTIAFVSLFIAFAFVAYDSGWRHLFHELPDIAGLLLFKIEFYGGFALFMLMLIALGDFLGAYFGRFRPYSSVNRGSLTKRPSSPCSPALDFRSTRTGGSVSDVQGLTLAAAPVTSGVRSGISAPALYPPKPATVPKPIRIAWAWISARRRRAASFSGPSGMLP